MSEQVLTIPTRKSVIGTLLMIKPFQYHSDSQDKEVTANSMLMRLESGNAFEVTASQDVAEFKANDVLFVSYEERQAETTGFKDNGVIKIHKNSGNSAIGITKL